MKRLGRIWPEVVNFENLLSAYLKARRGKQSVPSVAEFTLNLEYELLSLRHPDLEDSILNPLLGQVANLSWEKQFLLNSIHHTFSQ